MVMFMPDVSSFEGPTEPKQERTEPPRTEHAAMDEPARSSLFSPAIFAVSGTVVTLCITIVGAGVLGRLLTPEQYGIFAMALVPYTILIALHDLGITESITRDQSRDPQLASTLFCVSVASGLVAACLLIVAGLALAPVFGVPELRQIAAALALALALTAASTVPLGVLHRKLRFRAVSSIRITAEIVATLVGIGAAGVGAGMYALVLIMLVRAVLICIGSLALGSWKFSRPRFDRTSFLALRYGGALGVTRGLNAVFVQVDRAIIAKLFDAAALGLYTRAWFVASIPVMSVARSASDVALAGIAPITDDLQAARARYRRGLSAVAWVTIPLLTLMFASPAAVLGTLLGPDWIIADGLLRALSLLGLAQTMGCATNWVFLAYGLSGQQLFWRVFSGIVCTGALLVAAPHGTQALAWTLGIVMLLLRLPVTIHTLPKAEFPIGGAFRPFVPPFAFCSVAAMAGSGLLKYVSTDVLAWVELIIMSCAIGAGTIIGVMLTRDGREVMKSVFSLVTPART